MITCEHDRKVVYEIASLWISLGGDSEGFTWVVNDIFNEIKAQEKGGE